MAINKVVYDNTTLIDLTSTTAVESDVASGKVFFKNDGTQATGTASGGGGVTVEETPDIGGGTIIEITASTGTTLIRGVLRPDAELVQTYTYDEYLHADEGITIPSYTTSLTALISSVSLTPTITCDFATYDYYILVRMATIPEYNISTTGVGRQEYALDGRLLEVVRIPANTTHALVDPTKYYTSAYTQIVATGSNPMYVYYNSSSSLMSTGTNSYGYTQTMTSPTISTDTLTLKSPSFNVRGSTSYFSETYLNAVTDVRYQYVIDVYRSRKGDLNIDGWGVVSQWMKANEDILGSTHTLT